jgi:hypothetical protein
MSKLGNVQYERRRRLLYLIKIAVEKQRVTPDDPALRILRSEISSLAAQIRQEKVMR